MRLFSLLLLLVAAASARAQHPLRPSERSAVPSESAREVGAADGRVSGGLPADTAFASLVTVWPGAPSYARFGHTALRVHDPAGGVDLLYNYGTFRFDATFLPRFVYGALDYELSVVDFPAAVEYYATVERRGVAEQRLRLTPAQFGRLARFLEWNARPENAAYRYRFLDDNCTTRARDAIEQAMDGRIEGTTAGRDGYPSFRDLLGPYQTGAPLMHLGTDLGLGLRVDRPALLRQAQFLPDVLFADAAAARTSGDLPLVTRTDTLVALPRPPAEAFPWPLALGLAVLAFAAWQTLWLRAAPVVTRVDRALLAAAGVAGLVLSFLVFVSLHDVTRPNLNLAWALPTHLVYAFAAGRRARWLRPYALVTGIAAALFVLAAPFLPQAIPLAALPVVAALALRLLAHAGALPGHREPAA